MNYKLQETQVTLKNLLNLSCKHLSALILPCKNGDIFFFIKVSTSSFFNAETYFAYKYSY